MDKVVAICCRISKDRGGRTEGVQTQERFGREYAAATWPGIPIEVFADGDNSAMKPDGPRPEHDRFKEWLSAGRIAHVWTIEQSRLERDEIQWFGLAAELDDAGITRLHTRRDGIVDVRGEIAGLKAVLNASEVRKMRKRLLDTLADKATQGLPSPGLHTCYRRTRTEDGVKTQEPIPDRAEAFTWAAEALLAGWSLANVTAGLRRQGIAGSRGGEIREGAVKSALVSPVIAGLRVHQGEIVGKGNWEPILDETTWRAVVAKLTADRVVQRSDGIEISVPGTRRNRPGRKYLLTGGLTVCGVCGHEMVGALKQRRNRPERPWLLCHVVKGGKGCVAAAMDRVNKKVLDDLWAELDKPEFLDAITADDANAERREEIVTLLGDLEDQRKELAALWSTPGQLTTAEWSTARQGLTEQERGLNAELASIPPAGTRLDVAEARGAWEFMTLDEQREFVRRFVERVTIKRAAPRASRFDPDRVKVEWRTA